jgi:hypothetical protein
MAVREQGYCAACGRGPDGLHPRRLCKRCYHNPAVRHRFECHLRCRPRAWTAGEVRLLRDLRAGPVPLPIELCAVRLGRRVSQVSNACQRYGLGLYRRDRAGYAEAVRRLYDGRRTDGQIASEAGCSRATVTVIRRGMGLPAPPRGKPPGSVMRCFACPAICHTSSGRRLGWVSRPLPGRSETTEREVYCKKCFARWGWPKVPGDAP